MIDKNNFKCCLWSIIFSVKFYRQKIKRMMVYYFLLKYLYIISFDNSNYINKLHIIKQKEYMLNELNLIMEKKI